MRLGYAAEKFGAAVNGMAKSPKDIKERIYNAYVYNISLINVEDLPDDLGEDLREIKTLMNSVEATGDGGRARATIDQMTIEDAVELAGKITDLASLIESAYQNE